MSKRIPQMALFSGAEPTEAQKLLMIAEANVMALEDAERALETARREFDAGNVAAGAFHAGCALHAVRGAGREASSIIGKLHAELGDEAPELKP